MKRRIKIEQHDTYDCGAACLCSVAAWYGLYVPLAKVRRLCGCTKEGITIKGIIDGAAKLALFAEAFKSPDKDLDTLQESIAFPAIAHLKKENGFFHFVTIINIKGKHVEIMEPSVGEIKKISCDEFVAEWTGFIITLRPDTAFKQENRRSCVYRRLFSLLLSTRREIIHALSGTVALSVIGIITPLFLRHMIDNTIPNNNIGELITLSAIIILLTLFMLFISYAKNIFLAAHGMKIDNNLISEYIKKVFSLPADCFNQYTAGDFNSRVSDAFNIRLFISEGVVSVSMSAITLLASLIIIFKSNTTLAMLSTSFIPAYIGLYFLSSYINRRYNRELASSGARFETDMLQGMDGIISVRHYGAENLSIKRIEESYNNLANKIFDTSKAITLLGITADALSRGLVVATLVTGGFLVFGNTLSIGELVAFYTLCALFTTPLNNLVKMNSIIAQATVSAERLFEIIDIEPEHESPAIANSVTESWREINIRNLSFTYPGRDTLFNKLSTKLERGAITAICGESGCGKSTLASLIMHDYEPDEGAVYLDKTNITTIAITEWRRFITIVPQKVHLFNASLLDNITCGEQTPDTDRAISICAELGLVDFIQRLPMGLLTNIGEAGGALSGGEMQKIAIARAIYRDAQVIIFDEATSSVDKKSEDFIMQYITSLKQRGKTIVLITHNMEILKYADTIVNI